MSVYSPLPIHQYRLQGVKADETSVIMVNDRRDALWNMFWMSVPTLDNVPGSGTQWWRHYQPRVGALSAIISDVWGDDVLYQKLGMHPHAFCDWWDHKDHSIYGAYDKLGGDDWAKTVLDRGNQAANRLILSKPPVEIVGNVIKVRFGP